MLRLTTAVTALAACKFVHSFTPLLTSSHAQISLSTTPLRRLNPSALTMVDPLSFANAALDLDVTLELGVAVVSAAAGAISQFPRIQTLERERQAALAALTSSEAELVEKIGVLEEKLFVMDQEFEEQTARFKRQYDRTLREQMEVVKEKLKQEMQFKVEIEVAKERSAKLMQQAVVESGRTSKQEELSQMKLKQLQMQDINVKLEDALRSAEEELNNMRVAKSYKKKFIFF